MLLLLETFNYQSSKYQSPQKVWWSNVQYSCSYHLHWHVDRLGLAVGHWNLPDRSKLIFLGPRGPLRTPLVPVVRCPRQKITQPLIILFQTLSYYSFPLSDSKLMQLLPQNTVPRTLNRLISRTFLAQFGLVCHRNLLLRPKFSFESDS